MSMTVLRKLWSKSRDRAGQTMTEYALIMAAIAVVVYTAYTSLGAGVVNTVANVTSSL